MSKTVVVYHHGCLDGHAAKWVARQAFANNPDVEYLPGYYNDKNPLSRDKFKNAIVYFIDFSYPLEATKIVLDVAQGVIILDHHKSCYDMLQSPELVNYANPYTDHVTMDKSGCLIAWEYFFPYVEVPIVTGKQIGRAHV